MLAGGTGACESMGRIPGRLLLGDPRASSRHPAGTPGRQQTRNVAGWLGRPDVNGRPFLNRTEAAKRDTGKRRLMNLTVHEPCPGIGDSWLQTWTLEWQASDHGHDAPACALT